MRNLNRIDAFCTRLAAAWKENCPDMRFGQFIMNAFGAIGRDAFFPEDDEMIVLIEKWAENNSPYHKPPEAKPTKKTCRGVVLRAFPKAEFAGALCDGICAADVFGRPTINCDAFRDCETCWDQPAPEEYQEESV